MEFEDTRLYEISFSVCWEIFATVSVHDDSGVRSLVGAESKLPIEVAADPGRENLCLGGLRSNDEVNLGSSAFARKPLHGEFARMSTKVIADDGCPFIDDYIEVTALVHTMTEMLHHLIAFVHDFHGLLEDLCPSARIKAGSIGNRVGEPCIVDEFDTLGIDENHRSRIGTACTGTPQKDLCKNSVDSYGLAGAGRSCDEEVRLRDEVSIEAVCNPGRGCDNALIV